MGKVEHDEPVGQLGVSHGEGPGDEPTPIVADDHGLAGSEALHDGDCIADELFGFVVVDALGLTAGVITALIDGYDVEVFRELGHLRRQEYQKSGKPWMSRTRGSSLRPKLT